MLLNPYRFPVVIIFSGRRA